MHVHELMTIEEKENHGGQHRSMHVGIQFGKLGTIPEIWTGACAYLGLLDRRYCNGIPRYILSSVPSFQVLVRAAVVCYHCQEGVGHHILKVRACCRLL